MATAVSSFNASEKQLIESNLRRFQVIIETYIYIYCKMLIIIK